MSKECGKCNCDNDDSAVICKRCKAALEPGNDPELSNHTAGKTQIITPVLTLSEKKTGEEIIITDTCTIGREGDIEPEYFSQNMYVSRKHCRIILENGDFKIEHLSGKNPTKINDNIISKGIKKIIRNADILTIADMDFSAAIHIPKAPEPVINEVEEDFIYIIICPECGRRHEAADAEERIEECVECGNKKRISKEKAERVTKDAG